MALSSVSAAAAYVSHLQGLLLLAASLAMLLLVLVSKSYSRSRIKLPPGPPCLPIIGNMHLLLGKLPHQALAQLSKRYGPLLYLRFGSRPVVVVSNAKLAKEFLTTHDKVFASRPKLEAANLLLYGVDNSIGFGRYGPRWRQLRKLCTLELLTARKGQAFQNIRTEEVELMLRDVKHQSQDLGTLALDVKKFLGVLTSNAMGRIMLSRRVNVASTKRGVSMDDLVHELSVVFSTPLVGDFIPYLGFLNAKTKLQMDDLHRRLNDFLEDVLAERQRDRDNNPMDLPEDFLDLLLSANNIITEGEGLSRETIKATLLEMFSGGIDTSTVTVEWAMAELLRSPVTLEKLQTELRNTVGPERRVEVSDIPSLPYLRAVIKETFRLHPPLPLVLPRESSKACKVAGQYIIPANTTLLVNVWAIGRDPESWEKPLEFRPERFLEGRDIDVRGQHYELLPFGSGRRNCPGMPVGLSMVELALSNLVHSFDWELPSGQTPATLDMSEKPGVSAARATPLLAIAKPARLLID